MDKNATADNTTTSGFFQDIGDTLYLPVQISINLLKGLLYLPWWIFASLLSLMCFCFIVMFKKLIRHQSKSITDKLPGDSRNTASSRIITVGFFHPYCNAGGGGERVLWCAIRALQTRYDFVKCIVYTGDVMDKPEEIIERAKQRFNIDIKRHVHFVYLNKRPWVTAERYPVLTLLGQSFGSIVLGIEALWNFTPDIYLDTMGYAFTIPLFKYIGGCKVGCYVHYPTISTDMLKKVNERAEDFNNARFISQSVIFSYIKMIYYRLFAVCYGLCGRCSDVVMVNSSWTLNHINEIWKIPKHTSIVYPPCDTKSLLNISLDPEESLKAYPKQIISVAQFRPEKNHMLQLKVFKEFTRQLPKGMKGKYKLLLVGSCRGKGDEDRVALLKIEAKKLNINKTVKFHLNVSYEELLDLLMESTVGIHTMKDEHFGIGVVEFMAGGLVTLAHNSAGPKMDIVVRWDDVRTGYLADTVNSYVDSLKDIFSMRPVERYEMCVNARECVKKRFSEETFKKRFLAETEILLN